MYYFFIISFFYYIFVSIYTFNNFLRFLYYLDFLYEFEKQVKKCHYLNKYLCIIYILCEMAQQVNSFIYVCI